MSYGQPEDYNNGENNSIDMVPRWFEMLKELRNGTISYIQLIKREQIRPPVRPVCRRLGVAKLSDIVSEDILYRAIVQVAESQNQSGRAPRIDDSNDSDSSGGGSALGLDMSVMNLNQGHGLGLGQGHYPPHLGNGNNNAWNYQQQQPQRMQRHSFDGPTTRGYIGHRAGGEPHYQQQPQKSLYDRQARSSFHGVSHTQQYGTYADLENDQNGYLSGRLENTADCYGGEREVQSFGQQLFSGQDALNGGNNPNFHHQQGHDAMRPYGRADLPHKNMSLQNKSYAPPNNRMPQQQQQQQQHQNMFNSLNFNTAPLSTRGLGLNNSDPQSYSPLSSPRTSRGGPYHIGVGAIGNGGASLGTNISPRGHVGPYGYAGQGQVQGLGPGLGGHIQGQTDPRLLAEHDLNAVRPYAPMVSQAAVTTPRGYHSNPQVGNSGLISQSAHIVSKVNNYNNPQGSSLALQSPRTTSFMPFGNINSAPHRGLSEFGEFTVGSEFTGSDGLSQMGAGVGGDEFGTLGEYSNLGDYHYKGDYASSLLDPTNINRDHGDLGGTLESNLDSDPSSLPYGSRLISHAKPWENL